MSARRVSWLRRALFQVHLWTGLALGLYTVAISVSGSILVYSPAFGAWTHRDLRRVPAAEVIGRHVVTPAQALENVELALPGKRLVNLSVAVEPHQAHVVGLLDGREYRVAFVHPLTGQVSAPVHGRGPVIGWLDGLHSNFFSGRPGRVVNGVGGLLLVLLAATGLVIWWPSREGLTRALRIDWGANWKRVVFDVHNALGFWLLVPVVLLSITGAYFTWPQITRDLVSRVSMVTSRPNPRSAPPATGGPDGNLDVLLAQVRRMHPDEPFLRVDLPGGPRAPVVIVASRTRDASTRLSTTTFVDRYAGTVLEVRRGSQAQTWGDTIVEWLPLLHTGHFGGRVVHAVWAVLGLAPAVLFCTGFLMWWQRVIVPRRHRAQRRATRA